METEELIEHILRQKHLQEMMDRPVTIQNWRID